MLQFRTFVKKNLKLVNTILGKNSYIKIILTAYTSFVKMYTEMSK